jgi:hypothetical protein
VVLVYTIVTRLDNKIISSINLFKTRSKKSLHSNFMSHVFEIPLSQ